MNAVDLMLEVIAEHSPKSIWAGAPLEAFRRVENTNRGDIGEEFLRRYLVAHGGFSVQKSGTRADLIDLQIENRDFEVKTASLGVNRTFQFNHIRMDRDYLYLLCLGVCPEVIVFDIWRKEEVADGQAGRLVRMAQDQSTTFKLTKRLSDMRPIETLPDWIRAEFGKTVK